MDNEFDFLERYINDARLKFEHRRRLRESNLHDNIEFPDESSLESLDSSIKKNSAFVKRLKTFTDAQKCHILDEIDKLNLTKFTSEAATSIIEAKLKLSDVPSVVEICTKLNRLYRDFHLHLLNHYSKYLPTFKRRMNIDSNSFTTSPGHAQLAYLNLVKSLSNRKESQFSESPSSSTNISKSRVDLRLFSELLIVGILPLKDAFQLLVNFIHHLMIFDKNVQQNANALLTFCKSCGDELLGLSPIRVEQLAIKYQKEIPTSDYISAKRQTFLLNFFKDYFQQLSKNLGELENELSNLLSKNQKNCKSKGEMSRDAKDNLDKKCIQFQKLQNIVMQFAEILNEDAPIPIKFDGLNSETVETFNNRSDIIKARMDDESASQRAGSIWDDDGTRSFYVDLLDLKQLFPSLQVKVRSIRVASDESLNKMKLAEASQVEPPTDATNNDEVDQAGEDSSSTSSSSSDEDEIALMIDRQQSTAKSVSNRAQPEQYFNKLSNCVNRDMIDDAAIDFIKFFNTKFGRKKLIKTLFNVQRTRLDLLPFFARLTATIYPYVPNVGSDLAAQLKSEFRYLFKKKDQINIESKVKNVRYIGEFVKFNMISKQEAVSCLKMLLSDFTHHHIEMTCNLLETCGRLLYKSPDTHHNLKLILEQIMRKKMLLSIDSKYVTMIENAYYFTNPPEVVKQVVSEPPVQLYVRYLLYECLNRSNIDKVLKKLRLLNWESKNIAKFVINRMIEAYNVKFYNIRYFAALLAALNKDRPWISIAVVDGVVEDILLMMEINEIQFNQRRIPMIRYFGELFNYRLTDSSLVFKVLYSLITYGVVYHDPEQNLSQVALAPADPPENLFRIKLICDLLDTSGPYLNGSQEKKKLDCYLLFFQRYYWCKKHIFLRHPYCLIKNGYRFPASTEYLYNDTIFNLRPKFQMAPSYKEAIECLQSFLNSLQSQRQ